MSHFHPHRQLAPECDSAVESMGAPLAVTSPTTAKLYQLRYGNFKKILYYSGSLDQDRWLLSPNHRLLSHSSRPLSHKSIKIGKYTIRAAQNIKNFENRPNSDKVMMI